MTNEEIKQETIREIARREARAIDVEFDIEFTSIAEVVGMIAYTIGVGYDEGEADIMDGVRDYLREA